MVVLVGGLISVFDFVSCVKVDVVVVAVPV